MAVRGEGMLGICAGTGFGLYRFAVSRLYGSGLGATDATVGFVSNVPFVLAMNATSCLAALAALTALRRGGFRRACASPWVAAALLLLGVTLSFAPSAPPVGVPQGMLCGLGLFMLSIAWFDVFTGEPNASRMLAWLLAGVALYTALECAVVGLAGELRTLFAACALLASCALVQFARAQLPDTTRLGTRVPRPELKESLPVYLSFFVLVGVVGIMHTSVLGSSSEYIIGAVPMWATRVVSMAGFLLVILPQGARFNMTDVFKVVIPALIGVLTLMPFLGGSTGSLSGSLAIICYCVCGMLIYVFLIREGRKLRLSSVLLASVYTLGSSGFLFCGLCIGLLLRSLSASFDMSLLTLLAFVAIYPLVLGLVFMLRRDDQVRQRADWKREADATSARQSAALESAVATVATVHGLTKRERDVLSQLANGSSVHYIAESLVISENTAWTHVKRIYAKTGVHSKDELMALVSHAAEQAE